MVRRLGILLAFILAAIPVSAEELWIHTTWAKPLTYLQITIAILVIVTIFILTIGKDFAKKHPKPFFLLITIPVLLTTFYTAGHTTYENVISETGGPVHWHLDYQVWVCGERLDLVDPRGLRNKIGTPLFHEHDDDRIHVEGTVHRISTVSLGNYFNVIGGELSDGRITYPTDEGIVEYSDGDVCPDGTAGELAVYVNGMRQGDFWNHIMAPEALVPPGDCAIIEFGSNVGATTDRICDSWDALGWSYENMGEKRNG